MLTTRQPRLPVAAGRWRTACALALALGLATNTRADIDTAWVRTYDGPWHGTDHAMGVALDSCRNVVATYWSEKIEGQFDYVTRKYDSTGQLLWSATYDGPGESSSQPFAVAVDAAGNVLVTGASKESGRHERDIVTVKYNSLGEEQWVARYSGSGDAWDQPRDMAVDVRGNVYITGWEGVGLLRRCVTLKYDSAGQNVWALHYEGPYLADEFYAVGVDSAGDVYAAGRSMWDSMGRREMVTAKYSPDGEERWVVHYRGPAGAGEAMTLTPDGCGGTYVAGRSMVEPNVCPLTTVRFDSTGAPRWVALFQAPNSDGGRVEALAVDRAGNVHATGIVNSTGQDADYGTLMYDSLGNELWARLWAGAAGGVDWPLAVAVDTLCNTYVTGFSYIGPTPYDFECATVSYDSAGNERWTTRLTRGPYWDASGSAIAAAGPDQVYVTGFVADSVTLDDGLLIRYIQQPGAIEERGIRRNSGPLSPTMVRGVVELGPTVEAELVDATGRRVASLRTGANDLRNLAAGIYFLRLGSGNCAATRKLVVQR